MSFRQFILDSTGRVTLTTQAIADSPGAASIAGQAYMTSGEAAFATTDAVVASDVFNGGFRYTATGILRISDTTAGLPASTSINQGIAMTDDGQACITTEDNVTDFHLAGVALTDDSRIYVNLLSFMLPLDDLGAGEVDLVLKLGQGDPTFTRATTATTVNSAGTIVSVASGTARSWYDPTTLVYGGYLAEGARTNLCLQSEDFATTWSENRASDSINQTSSPDGAATADKLIENTDTNTHFMSQAITGTADVNYTVSVFFKAAERTWAKLLVHEAAAVANNFSQYYDLGNGALGTGTQAGTAARVSSTITAYPNGWYRCIVVGSVGNAATALLIRVMIASADNSDNYEGNGTSGIYAWGAQFENNVSFASSYIPTTTAAVVRNTDVLTYDFAGNASATAGTCYAELGTEWTAASGNVIPIGLDTGVNSLFFRGNGGADTALAINDGTNTVSKTGLSQFSTGTRKIVGSWGDVGLVITGDGLTVSTGTFDGTMPSTALAIGSNTAGGNNWFGTIKNVRIWTSQLPDGELQVITT
jgi:hypothetical protein